ncbi:MAG: hypothetical protein BGO40_13705 [Chryseobacterium sp. 39-10]|nr:MAG: hypothetical protein BGO40_13705 [Chryseobacterium sp. 39-10]
MNKVSVTKWAYVMIAVFCMSPWSNSPLSLLLGFVFALLMANPFAQFTHRYIHLLLQISIVGLGFGLNIEQALAAGKSGFLLTVFSISTVLVAGYALGRLLKIEQPLAYLISVGTAICGGSAIAAVSPIIKAKSIQISLALAIIFTLNSIALFAFPVIGHALHLSQQQFGLWAAVGIHDTSSVVGAANRYGGEALKIATTVKLARALWIIPVSLMTMFIFKNESSKVKIPWFIVFFIGAIGLNTFIPSLSVVTPYILTLSKAGLNLTLFLIGTTLTISVLRTISVKPLLLAVALWITVSVGSLLYIINK